METDGIPPLKSLIAFQMVARCGSFSDAATILGLTQSGISRRIMRLEEDVGVELFERTASGVVLTRIGAEYAQEVAAALDVLTNLGARSLKRQAQGRLTLSCSRAVGELWLVPRLLKFRAQHPGAAFRVVSRDDRIDLGTGEVDLVIRFGSGPFPDGAVVASRKDRIFPVCSPDYAAALDLDAFPDCAFDLIEQDVPDRAWIRWTDWFAQTGARPAQARASLRFTYFTDTLAAARAGDAAALVSSSTRAMPVRSISSPRSEASQRGRPPVAVLAPRSPSDCFDIAVEAARIAIKYHTPVVVLSDGAIANGSEPWRIPDIAVTEEPAPSMTLYTPEVPKELDEVVLKALAMDPADRWASAREAREPGSSRRTSRPLCVSVKPTSGCASA